MGSSCPHATYSLFFPLLSVDSVCPWKLTVASSHKIRCNIFFVSATAIKLIRFQLIFSLRYRKRALKEISTYCFNCHRKLPIKYLVRFFLPPPFQCASSLALLHYWPIVLSAFHAHNVSVDENRKR